MKFVGPAVVVEPVQTSWNEADEKMDVDHPSTSGANLKSEHVPEPAPQPRLAEPTPKTSTDPQKPQPVEMPAAPVDGSRSAARRISRDQDMDSPVKRMVAFLKSPTSTDQVPQLGEPTLHEETNKVRYFILLFSLFSLCSST